MNSTSLLEFVQHAGTLEVDAERGVIKGVRVLGLESANNRTYLREGVKAALHLYEGRQVNADHPTKPGEAVSIDSRIGWLENVRQEADGGLRGDLHLLLKDQHTPKILETAQRRPQLMGLSHNVSGRTRRENGREIVESIEAVHSVDLVADPATTNGLHEGKIVKHKVKHLIESLKASRPGYSRALKEMAEAGLMSPDTEVEEPAPKGPEVSEPADHETALKQGFRAAINAALDDDGMDLKAKIKKIKEILTMEEKMLAKADDGGDSNPDAGADTPAVAAAEESRRLRLENTGLKLLGEAGIKTTPIITRALAGCKTEAEVKELVEAAQAQNNGTGNKAGAKSAPAWQEPAGASRGLTEGQIPEDAKSLRRWLSN